VLPRLEPRPGGQLSGGDLFLAYKGWCDKGGFTSHERGAFGRQFTDLAKVADIMFSGKGTQGSTATWR
jgi:hypothetical protein